MERQGLDILEELGLCRGLHGGPEAFDEGGVLLHRRVEGFVYVKDICDRSATSSGGSGGGCGERHTLLASPSSKVELPELAWMVSAVCTCADEKAIHTFSLPLHGGRGLWVERCRNGREGRVLRAVSELSYAHMDFSGDARRGVCEHLSSKSQPVS